MTSSTAPEIQASFKDREQLFVTNGTPVKLELECAAPTNKQKECNIVWQLISESKKKVKHGSFKATISDKYNYPFTFNITRNGSYRLEVAIHDGNRCTKAETLFSVFPKPLSPSPKNGIIGATGVQGVPRMVALAKACGVSWHRRHCGKSDTRYIRVIKNGKLDLSYLQPGQELDQKQGFNILGSLFISGKGKKRDNLYWEKDFDRYMDAWLNTYTIPLVKATKDYIRYWEVGNEPYYEFRKHPEIYVTILKKTYEAIKKIDPEIKIVGVCGPPRSIGEDWFKETFKHGALNYMDILSFHQYCFTNRLISSPEKGFIDWFGAMRKMLKKNGKENMPIWNSETSVSPPATMYTLPKHLKRVRYLSGHTSPDNRQQSAVMTRILTVHYANNIKYIFHLFGANSTYTCHPSEFDGSPCGFAVSMAAANRLLEGKKSLGNIKLNDRIKAYAFNNSADQQTVVFWLEQLYPEDTAKLELVSQLQTNTGFDIFANKSHQNSAAITISPEPVYVTFAQPMTAAVLKKLLKNSKITMKEGCKIQTVGDMKKATPGDWTGYYPINLAPYANQSFRDEKAGDKQGGFTDEGDNDLRGLHGGDFIANNIPFRIIDGKENNGKSCIVLGSKIRRYYPREIKGIKVGKGNNGERLTKLHFLHMCTNAYLARNNPIFTYVIHYADGTTEKIEVVEGKNIADWYNRKDLPQAKAVLHMPNLHTDEVNLFHYEWSTSHPKGAHARIISIDIIGSDYAPIPVIVAITGVLSN